MGGSGGARAGRCAAMTGHTFEEQLTKYLTDIHAL
jgi:hypothetical protein